MPKKEKGGKIEPRSDCSEGLAKNLDAAKERNAELTKKVEFLQSEVCRLEGVVRQVNASRDNWRKRAIDKNATLEAVLSCIRRYVEAEKAESVAADETLKRMKTKQAAFRDLLDCQTDGGGK